jgi:hypothetical protein
VVGQEPAVEPGDAGLGPLPLVVPRAPAPGVAEPEGRQQAQAGRLGPAVGNREPDEQVVRAGLGVLGGHVPVPVPVERIGVGDLELGVGAGAAAGLVPQPPVRELALGVLVEGLEVAVGRGGVQVEVRLLDVLGVVPLGVGQPEQPLLQV